MQFPLKPFLDRVIVEVIPIEDYYERSETIGEVLDRTFSQRSDRGIVKAVGESSEIVQVGDVVQFDPDTAYAGLLFLNPADRNKPEKPKYLEIRIGDLLGKVVATEIKRPTINELQKILDTDENLDLRVNPDGSVSAVPARPPFETFKNAICRGSYILGSACGQCERCKWEREHTVTHA